MHSSACKIHQRCEWRVGLELVHTPPIPIAPSLETLSIVIPTHQRPKLLHRLLSSLVESGLSKNAQLMQVIVVANLADSKTRQVAALFFGHLPLIYFEGSKVGVNAARNLGLRQAIGDIVAFLDDDCVIEDPFYADKILNLHRGFPESRPSVAPTCFETSTLSLRGPTIPFQANG